jgi:hypothetical protein
MPQDTTTTTLAIIAIAAALGLLSVIAITYTQQAESISPIGQCASTIKNGSASLCHTLRPDTSEPLGLLPDTP